VNTNRYQVVEVSESLDFCGCCGKTGLKRVVFIRDTETDEVNHFGTVCATKPAKGFAVDKEVKAAISRFESKVACAHHIARTEYKKQGGTYLPYNRETGVWAIADRPLYDGIFARTMSEVRFNF